LTTPARWIRWAFLAHRIRSTADFNALAIDVFSLRFGRTGQEDSLRRVRGIPLFHDRDANHDGRLDLVVQVQTDLTGFQPGGQPVFLYCKSCRKKVLADPNKTLAKVEKLRAKAVDSAKK
jgi:hypothetical protein